MTFSIVGRCARTGMVGVAGSSSSIALGARCPHARAGVGAVSSQNVTNPVLGIEALGYLAEGASAAEAVAKAVARERYPDYRQLLVIDKAGRTAAHSGAKALGVVNEVSGPDCLAAGNLLKDKAVIAAMVEAFASAPDRHLAERLVLALEAGQQAGGEAGPAYSAYVEVHDVLPVPLVGLRVDWDENGPIAALRRHWQLYEPQMAAYVQRALDPSGAPSFGVPGDR